MVRQVGQCPAGTQPGALGTNPPGLTEVVGKILPRLEGPGVGPAYWKPGGWFRCGEVGHFKRDCPRGPAGVELGTGTTENGLGQLYTWELSGKMPVVQLGQEQGVRSRQRGWKKQGPEEAKVEEPQFKDKEYWNPGRRQEQ